eukprot:9490205-Pyramimonas_sp.AAC.1
MARVGWLATSLFTAALRACIHAFSVRFFAFRARQTTDKIVHITTNDWGLLWSSQRNVGMREPPLAARRGPPDILMGRLGVLFFGGLRQAAVEVLFSAPDSPV